jgi:hypothetical protein
MKLIYLQKFRCGSLAYIGSWSYNGVVQAADYVLLLDENSYLMRRHDGTVNYYVASFSGGGRFGLESGGFMDIGVEVDGSKFYAVCEENKVYLGSFTNVKYVQISLADGIVTKVSEIEVDSNNRVLKTYGCPFAPAWGHESAYSVAFMGGPLKVFNLSAYGSGPTIGVAEGFGRCPVLLLLLRVVSGSALLTGLLVLGLMSLMGGWGRGVFLVVWVRLLCCPACLRLIRQAPVSSTLLRFVALRLGL